MLAQSFIDAVASLRLEEILRAELRWNYALPHSNHLLFPQCVFKAKEPGDELLRIAQRDQPLIGQHRIRYLEGQFLGLPGAIGVLGSTSN